MCTTSVNDDSLFAPHTFFLRSATLRTTCYWQRPVAEMWTSSAAPSNLVSSETRLHGCRLQRGSTCLCAVWSNACNWYHGVQSVFDAPTVWSSNFSTPRLCLSQMYLLINFLGEGRVHKCLRDNRKQLSDACRKEELLLEEKEVRVVHVNGGRVTTYRGV